MFAYEIIIETYSSVEVNPVKGARRHADQFIAVERRAGAEKPISGITLKATDRVVLDS